MKRLLVTALVLLAAATTPAAAEGQTRIVAADPIYQTWVDEAAINATPRMTLRVSETPCWTVAAACYQNGQIRMDRIADGSYTDQFKMEVFYHELSHAFAEKHLRRSHRRQIIRLLGYPAGTGWRQTDQPPAERFAEAGRSCYVGGEIIQPAYGFSLSFQQTSPICSVMVRASALSRASSRTVSQSTLRMKG